MSVVQAKSLLAAHGFSGARLEVTGHAGEVVAIAVPEALWERMLGPDGREASEQIRALGFRYVALDLAAS